MQHWNKQSENMNHSVRNNLWKNGLKLSLLHILTFLPLKLKCILKGKPHTVINKLGKILLSCSIPMYNRNTQFTKY